MESVARHVDKIESGDRRVYEAVLGRALRENQQIRFRVIELEKDPNRNKSGTGEEGRTGTFSCASERREWDSPLSRVPFSSQVRIDAF